MSGDREVTSEQSSIRKAAGYDELYSSGREPKEYLSSSPKREPSTHSFAKEEEEYEEDEEEDVGEEDEEGEGEMRGVIRVTSRRWSVKRSATVLGLSSFPLYGRWMTSIQPCPQTF